MVLSLQGFEEYCLLIDKKIYIEYIKHKHKYTEHAHKHVNTVKTGFFTIRDITISL